MKHNQTGERSKWVSIKTDRIGKGPKWEITEWDRNGDCPLVRSKKRKIFEIYKQICPSRFLMITYYWREVVIYYTLFLSYLLYQYKEDEENEGVSHVSPSKATLKKTRSAEPFKVQSFTRVQNPWKMIRQRLSEWFFTGSGIC